ncbi:hypothetical protein F2Q69_00021251 [Brassica cretica]|uniref:Uncharacterized protein n=1 Tax=Brassica cretica TaxID=69181 RepID=A0A8S9PXD6_BRACR|nr:hypothetical protein F2Q69_00021251 [Brassica cretica]
MKQRHVPESSLLRSMATVTFELLRDFCNGLRYGFIVLNPINSNVHVVFFNVLLASARRHLRGSSSRSWMDLSFDTRSVSPAGAGSGEKEPERTKVKKLAVYGNLIFEIVGKVLLGTMIMHM